MFRENLPDLALLQYGILVNGIPELGISINSTTRVTLYSLRKNGESSIGSQTKYLYHDRLRNRQIMGS